ncbi:MAG: retropepsin-like aspartic protease [Bacteroidota bacterium]
MSEKNFAYTVKRYYRYPLVETLITVFPEFDHNLPRQEWPDGAEVRAVWDTGCSNTAISSRLAKLLNLRHLGYVTVQNSIKSAPRTVYGVSLWIKEIDFHTVVFRVHEFNESEGIDVLIGMDIIKLGDFAITRDDNNNTVMSWCHPHREHIDFEIK